MREYILFIDTETSGLPEKWDAPYGDLDKWPFIVQIAWLIYSKDGKFLKAENHYIKDTDYHVSQISRNIHGISPEFLHDHGEQREQVMKILQQDLLEYSPLLVGHFMQLDFHMMGVGFYRAGLENPSPELPRFCTMEITRHFLRQKPYKYMKLGELYERLFEEQLKDQHNALADAKATAACFFKLKDQGDIDEAQLSGGQKPKKKILLSDYFNWIILLLLLIVLLLMIYWI